MVTKLIAGMIRLQNGQEKQECREIHEREYCHFVLRLSQLGKQIIDVKCQKDEENADDHHDCFHCKHHH